MSKIQFALIAIMVGALAIMMLLLFVPHVTP